MSQVGRCIIALANLLDSARSLKNIRFDSADYQAETFMKNLRDALRWCSRDVFPNRIDLDEIVREFEEKVSLGEKPLEALVEVLGKHGYSDVDTLIEKIIKDIRFVGDALAFRL